MSDFNLFVQEGDTNRIQATITRNGSAVNLTGATFKLVCKRWASDDEDDALFVVEDQQYFSVASPTSGVVVVTIPDGSLEATMNLNTTLVMTEADSVVTTVARGVLVVRE